MKRTIPDKSQELNEGDYFRFKKIIVISRKSTPSGKVGKRSGEHRGQKTTHQSGECFIDQQWEVLG